jgi:translation initiation factor IF-1
VEPIKDIVGLHRKNKIVLSFLNEKKKKFISNSNGTILKPIKDIMFHVRLHHNSQTVLGYLSGNMRRNRIRVLLGDRIKIRISEFDSKKGRIFYRFPPLSKQTRKKKLRMIIKRWRITPLLNHS